MKSRQASCFVNGSEVGGEYLARFTKSINQYLPASLSYSSVRWQRGSGKRKEAEASRTGPVGTLCIACQDDKLYAFQDEQRAEDSGT